MVAGASCCLLEFEVGQRVLCSMFRCAAVWCVLCGVTPADEGPAQGHRPLSEPEVERRAKLAVIDPSKLVGLIDQVSDKEARRVLKAALKSQPAEKSGAERDGFAVALAKALPRVARTPEQILDVMGGDSPKTVVRQIFYRRYREQWIFEHPIRFCVVFDCEKGKDSRVMAALPLTGNTP
jgi:hypothetical protein